MRRRLAALVATCCLLETGAGSVITTLRPAPPPWAAIHLWLGIGLGLFAFALAVWCLLDKHPALRSLGLLIAVTTGLEALPGAVMIHACFAPVLFTAAAVTATFRPAKSIQSSTDHPPALRSLLVAAPPLVFLQIVLGAAYRHKLASVMFHMGGALLVAGLVLVICVLLLRRFADHPVLKRLATVLIAIVLLQVSLGIAVFMMRLLDMDTAPALLVAAGTHMIVGAMTLAATTVLAIQYQRTVP